MVKKKGAFKKSKTKIPEEKTKKETDVKKKEKDFMTFKNVDVCSHA